MASSKSTTSRNKIDKYVERARKAYRIGRGGSPNYQVLKIALYDLWMDTYRRPRERGPFEEVRCLVARLLGREEAAIWRALHHDLDILRVQGKVDDALDILAELSDMRERLEKELFS